MLAGTEWFECQCFRDEHTLRVTLNLEEDLEASEIYTSVLLDTKSAWWRRIPIGIRYILGASQPHCGYFGNWVLRYEDAKRLRDMIQRLIDHVDA